MNYDTTLNSIKDLCIKTLIGVEPQIRTQWRTSLGGEEEGDWQSVCAGHAGVHPQSCYEMYGFDVILDADLRPWLLEVNICPSLSSGSPMDKRIKTKLVADTLTLVGVSLLPSLYRTSVGCKRTSSDMNDVEEDESGLARMPCAESLAKRKARIAIAKQTDA